MGLNYGEQLQTVETFVEIGILVIMIIEGSKVVQRVGDIYDSTATVPGSTDKVEYTTEDGSTNYGSSEDLKVGSKVHVQMPTPGVPRNGWPFGDDIWVIREINQEKGRALATPIFSPSGVPTPTVEGPISGPLSPFKRATVPG